MRKNIMKATTLLLAAAMTMSLFVGCGKEEPKTESIVEDSKTQEDASNNVKTEATENNKDASKEEDSQEVNPFLGPNGLMFASEDDVEILVDGKPIKLKMTREELDKMVEDYGYTIEDPKYVKSIYTPVGEIRVTVTGDELMSIGLIPSLIDLSKVSINGVTFDKVETLKNDTNIIEDKDGGYFQISIADYTTIAADYNSEGVLMVIHLTRQQYSLR